MCHNPDINENVPVNKRIFEDLAEKMYRISLQGIKKKVYLQLVYRGKIQKPIKINEYDKG
jgi:hypothetical protein